MGVEGGRQPGVPQGSRALGPGAGPRASGSADGPGDEPRDNGVRWSSGRAARRGRKEPRLSAPSGQWVPQPRLCTWLGRQRRAQGLRRGRPAAAPESFRGRRLGDNGESAPCRAGPLGASGFVVPRTRARCASGPPRSAALGPARPAAPLRARSVGGCISDIVQGTPRFLWSSKMWSSLPSGVADNVTLVSGDRRSSAATEVQNGLSAISLSGRALNDALGFVSVRFCVQISDRLG